jgi:hypothetical protein
MLLACCMTFPTDRKNFTDPAAWGGFGCHSLGLRYRNFSRARLQAARDALWSFPGLEGCWRRNDREPSAASRIASTYGLDPGKPLYGLAHLPGSSGVACMARVRIEDHRLDDDCPLCRELALQAGPPDGWLDLGLPFGGLGLAYPIGAYPCDDGSSLAWRDEVDAWLRGLAEHVHRSVPFDMALIGWSDGAFGPLPASAEEVWEERSLGYLFPGPRGLAWFPPTMGAPVPELLAVD